MVDKKRIPRNLPVMHIDNIVMFPYLMMPLVISDELLKKVIENAISNDKLVAFFLSKPTPAESGDIEIYNHGTAVSILRMLRNQDGSISVLLQGVARIRLEQIVEKDPFLIAEIEPINESQIENRKLSAQRKIAMELVDEIVEESPELNKELTFGLKNIQDDGRVADIISGNLPLMVEEKQEILEAVNFNERFEKLNRFLAEMIKQIRLETRIRKKMQLEMDEDQRKYYLREQLDAIKKELGESNEIDQEILKWREKIQAAGLPLEIMEIVIEELDRLAMMSSASSEYSVIRNYIDWMISVPWNQKTKDRMNLKRIEEILTHEHFGLEKPKERILEYIAVKKLKNELKGPILCFVGPPGVGKTSIGKSVANSMKRKFIRMSLGGIHDEAEIRGHRKTYIGAMPGKIISEIKRCGSKNPVFMLDEIDKLGKDFRGDPASALLEVLDPEQNNSFMDNYLNVPFDLSDVFFITTANQLDTIPAPLRDRMEIIEFSSYLEEEKIEIARKYLIPIEMDNNGISGKNIRFRKSGLQELIRYYIRESGVRTLRREISSVMRKVARKVASGENVFVTITSANVKKFLGPRKFSLELANRKPEIGVVTGMAWTMYGGEILFCEANMLPGKGGLILTGRLGEVMKESAKIAHSYIKANYHYYGLELEMFERFDIHIHLPAGAVPKDGPSAGVTLTTCLISLLSKKKANHEIAMTGEITLLGNVLPIGGVREKILAAKRAGIKKVLLPLANKGDISQINKNILEDLEIQFVEKVSEVVEATLIDKIIDESNK